MNTRKVLGKKIVRVNQYRFYNHHLKKMDISVESFVLDNGVILVFTTGETDDDYVTDVLVIDPKQQ